jgi:hypothetical protein
MGELWDPDFGELQGHPPAYLHSGGPLCRVFVGRGPERGGRSCCFCHVRAISGLSFGSTMWHVRPVSATQLRTYTDLSMYA